MKPRRWWKRVRDAVTGRFVRHEEADERPASTVTERVERVEDDEKR